LGKSPILKIGLGSCFGKLKYFDNKGVPRYFAWRKKKTNSTKDGMITRTNGSSWSQSYASNNTLTNMVYTTIKANLHEALFNLVSCNKFFVGPHFCLT
jgi:hypothetical protein